MSALSRDQIVDVQWRSVTPEVGCNFAAPKSREMHDAPHFAALVRPLVIAALGGPPLSTPPLATPLV